MAKKRRFTGAFCNSLLQKAKVKSTNAIVSTMKEVSDQFPKDLHTKLLSEAMKKSVKELREFGHPINVNDLKITIQTNLGIPSDSRIGTMQNIIRTGSSPSEENIRNKYSEIPNHVHKAFDLFRHFEGLKPFEKSGDDRQPLIHYITEALEETFENIPFLGIWVEKKGAVLEFEDEEDFLDYLVQGQGGTMESYAHPDPVFETVQTLKTLGLQVTGRIIQELIGPHSEYTYQMPTVTELVKENNFPVTSQAFRSLAAAVSQYGESGMRRAIELMKRKDVDLPVSIDGAAVIARRMELQEVDEDLIEEIQRLKKENKGMGAEFIFHELMKKEFGEPPED